MADENDFSWCWLGLHQYTPWEDGKTIKLSQYNDRVIRELLVQRKRCKGCNKVKTRQITVWAADE